MGKKSTKSTLKSLPKSSSKPSIEPPVSELDINAFIQEQQLEVDQEVIPLLSMSAQPLKKKKNSNKIKSYKDPESLVKSLGSVETESQEKISLESMGDSEDEKELQAYLEMVSSQDTHQDPEESENEEMTVTLYPNKKTALTSRLQDIQLPSHIPWIETLVVTSLESCTMDKEQVHDDLQRELGFYKQALEGAKEGRKKICKAGIPFSRPNDYFAEMIKSDEHMARIRQRLLDEAQALKASELARKQREAKKFGKKVQMEKLAEREKSKKDELEKIKLARKKKDSVQNHQENQDQEDMDLFDVDIDTPTNKEPSKERKKSQKRVKKDQKFGFGGVKKHKKSNTRESTDDLRGFNLKKMKNKSRVGKQVGKRVGKQK